MELLLIIISLLLSFFFSGTETIFLSSSRIKIEILFRKGVKGAKLVKQFVAKPESFIITTLLGNNIVNVAFSSIFTVYLQHQFPDYVIIFLSSFIVLVFGEIIPKAVGWELANHLVIKAAFPLKFFEMLLAPLVQILTRVSSMILNVFRIEETQVVPLFTKNEIEALIQESEKAGIVKKKEREIISRVFDLRETQVKETMVPRTDIIAIKKNTSMRTVFKIFQQSGFSRLPVYDKNIDDIIGVVYAKELLGKARRLEDITREIQLVPATKNAFTLLQEFRGAQTSIAIVLDEYGGTAGLVTFEDLVEELFGEIYDEFDLDHEQLFKKLNKFTFLVKGRAEIDELNRKFNLRIPEGNYTTLGGFIIDRIGKIPKIDDEIELNTCKMVITSATHKTVEEVKIIKKT